MPQRTTACRCGQASYRCGSWQQSRCRTSAATFRCPTTSTDMRVLNPSLQWLMAKARQQELRCAAAAARRPRRRQRCQMASFAPLPAVTIRHGLPDDGLALLRLAALDSAEPLQQPVLVADVDGELHAALSLRDGAVIADPFRRTSLLVELLLARHAQLVAATPAVADARSGRQVGRVLRARLRAAPHRPPPGSGDEYRRSAQISHGSGARPAHDRRRPRARSVA